jgi:MoaA/NifB/PqqE/SkfB family radical SAM enzyme
LSFAVRGDWLALLVPKMEIFGHRNATPSSGYDVEADWMLLDTCNYRCDYCFFDAETLGRKVKVRASVEDWVEGFEATGKTWHLHITGGEPTLHPQFIDLCTALSTHHVLSLNSNLSHRSILHFADRVDPARVRYVNAGFHPHERQERKGVETFVAHYRALKAAGFDVVATCVMTPEAIPSFADLCEAMSEAGIVLVPKVMRGAHRGHHYPQDYTPDEREQIHAAFVRLWSKMSLVGAREGEPLANTLMDDRMISSPTGGNAGSVLSYRGKPCWSGSKFVVVSGEGTVIRCGSGEVLGNILRRDVALLAAPKLCDTSYCPYFCAKYTKGL